MTLLQSLNIILFPSVKCGMNGNRDSALFASKTAAIWEKKDATFNIKKKIISIYGALVARTARCRSINMNFTFSVQPLLYSCSKLYIMENPRRHLCARWWTGLEYQPGTPRPPESQSKILAIGHRRNESQTGDEDFFSSGSR